MISVWKLVRLDGFQEFLVCYVLNYTHLTIIPSKTYSDYFFVSVSKTLHFICMVQFPQHYLNAFESLNARVLFPPKSWNIHVLFPIPPPSPKILPHPEDPKENPIYWIHSFNELGVGGHRKKRKSYIFAYQIFVEFRHISL